jgi:holo-[acyl-carrier protein] synthase
MRTLVGIDAQSIEEVAASISEYGMRYLQRVFTPYEISRSEKRPESAAVLFAKCFAAKEAVLKALRVSDVVPGWHDIEVRRRGLGSSEISLYGLASDLAEQQGVTNISLSFDQDGGVVIAIALAHAREQAPSER